MALRRALLCTGGSTVKSRTVITAERIPRQSRRAPRVLLPRGEPTSARGAPQRLCNSTDTFPQIQMQILLQ